ncbi:MAG: NAD(P)/FAD-dependent oxidoreductase, partial [Acidimicrobiales bacterium]
MDEETTSATPDSPPRETDVLVIGGGPAGAAAAYWLATAGRRVTVIEKKTFPREKTCGDGLTPRAVKQITDMGLASSLEKWHRYEGLRATAHGKALELQWPSHSVYPQHGYVVRRRELDMSVALNAQAAGAELLQGHEAHQPILERGLLRGAVVTDKAAHR